MGYNYEGAADAMQAAEQPKTPCRNYPTRPCVRQLEDGRKKYPKTECLPHHCARGYQETYEAGKIPHEMVLDSDGELEYFEQGDYHGGPKCVRCGVYFCIHCWPDVLTEACSNQDLGLF